MSGQNFIRLTCGYLTHRDALVRVPTVWRRGGAELMELSLAALSGFIAALIAPSLNRIGRDSTDWLLAVFPSILFLQSVSPRRRAVDGPSEYIRAVLSQES
jgi:hypothetical protein